MNVKILGFVVVSETATDMVCMRFVKRKDVEVFLLVVKTRFSSFTSEFISLSIDEDDDEYEEDGDR